MSLRPELRRFAGRSIENVASEVLANEGLLAAEPLTPPSNPKQRAGWEKRTRERRAAIRRGAVELAHLLAIERDA